MRKNEVRLTCCKQKQTNKPSHIIQETPHRVHDHQVSCYSHTYELAKPSPNKNRAFAPPHHLTATSRPPLTYTTRQPPPNRNLTAKIVRLLLAATTRYSRKTTSKCLTTSTPSLAAVSSLYPRNCAYSSTSSSSHPARSIFTPRAETHG